MLDAPLTRCRNRSLKRNSSRPAPRRRTSESEKRNDSGTKAIFESSGNDGRRGRDVARYMDRLRAGGRFQPGISEDEMKAITLGWSVKKKILGKPVYNDDKQKIGLIDDLIIIPVRLVPYAIIGVGGFLGIGKHDVAIPMSQCRRNGTGSLHPEQPGTPSGRCRSSSTRSSEAITAHAYALL